MWDLGTASACFMARYKRSLSRTYTNHSRAVIRGRWEPAKRDYDPERGSMSRGGPRESRHRQENLRREGRILSLTCRRQTVFVAHMNIWPIALSSGIFSASVFVLHLSSIRHPQVYRRSADGTTVVTHSPVVDSPVSRAEDSFGSSDSSPADAPLHSVCSSAKVSCRADYSRHSDYRSPHHFAPGPLGRQTML